MSQADAYKLSSVAAGVNITQLVNGKRACHVAESNSQ